MPPGQGSRQDGDPLPSLVYTLPPNGHRTELERMPGALDDLYDQRDRAASWLRRLLLATSVALRGAGWEQPMTEAATAVELIQLSGDTDEAKNAAALAVTGGRRLRLAGALSSSLRSPDGILIADPARRLPTIW